MTAAAPASGGAKPAIVFSHANGFPAGTYAQLFAAWRAAGHEVHAVDKIGHDRRYPASSNWPHLTEELTAFIEREGCGPAYLVGHSLGGFLSLLAASERPDLARGVVLLDSPLIEGWRAGLLAFFKTTGIGERFSPGHVSKRRRQAWDSAAAAHAHFMTKPAFAAFAPGVLADYIAAGVEHGAQGGEARLAFDRAIETTIYNTLPHHFSKRLRLRPLRCPMAFIGGSESDEVRRVGLGATRRATHGRMSTVQGSHLFPLERPAETAGAVLGWLAKFADTRHL